MGGGGGGCWEEGWSRRGLPGFLQLVPLRRAVVMEGECQGLYIVMCNIMCITLWILLLCRHAIGMMLRPPTPGCST